LGTTHRLEVVVRLISPNGEEQSLSDQIDLAKRESVHQYELSMVPGSA
jgi:hypothetical protein